MTTTTLERIADHEQKLKAQAADAYRNLVRDMESGKGISPEHAMRTLRDAGKTPADLKKAAGLIRDRRAWAEQAGELKDAESALNSLDAEEAAALRMFQKAQETYKASRLNVIARRPALLSRHADAMRAIDQLERTSDDPGILDAEHELAAESHRLAMREKSLRSTLDDRKKHASTLRIKLNNAAATARNWFQAPGMNTPRERAAAMRAEVAEFNRTAVEPIESQLTEIGQKRADLNRESAQLAEQKLVP